MTPTNDPGIYDSGYYSSNRSFYNPQRFYFHVGIIIGTGAKKVLDVGCGPNTLCKLLRMQGIDAVGIDFSPDSGADILASITDLPFQDNEFDLVFSCDVMEHAETGMVPKVISECIRVGRKQAHHICTEEDERESTRTKGLHYDDYHITCRPRIWWMNEFMKQGQLIEFEYHMHVNTLITPIPTTGMLCNHLWLFGGEHPEITLEPASK